MFEVAEGVINHSETAIGTSCCDSVADLLGNSQLLPEILHCLLEVVEEVVSMAEIAIGTSFSGPVTDFLGNAKVLVVVI